MTLMHCPTRMPLLRSLAIVFAALSLFLTVPASAMDLDQAKRDGIVGETHTGYLAVVKTNPEARELVREINDKRKQYYQKIAEKNNISLQAVEARAGLKAIEKTPAGFYINTGSGWQKK